MAARFRHQATREVPIIADPERVMREIGVSEAMAERVQSLIAGGWEIVITANIIGARRGNYACSYRHDGTQAGIARGVLRLWAGNPPDEVIDAR